MDCKWARHCIVEGISYPLEGDVVIPSAKNSSMPILIASSLLATLGNSAITINHLPKISDIKILCDILDLLGVDIDSSQNNKTIIGRKSSYSKLDDIPNIPNSLSSLIRSSIYTVAIPLINCGQVYIGSIGGDKIDGRNMDPHLRVFKGFGIDLQKKGDGWNLSGRPKPNVEFDISDNGITATCLAMIMAAALDGRTVIRNASQELENYDLLKVINMFGANAFWDDKDLIVIGPMKFDNHTIDLPPDQVVWGTYAIASILTRGNVIASVRGDASLLLSRCKPIVDMIDFLGCSVRHSANKIFVTGIPERAVTVETGIYPMFPSDLVPQTTVLMSRLPGVSKVVENLYDSRFGHASELKKMGIDIEVNSNRAIIRGSTKAIAAATLNGGGIRESCALVLSGLVAEGKTNIMNAGAIDRGYEDFVSSLSNLGANVSWVKSRV